MIANRHTQRILVSTLPRGNPYQNLFSKPYSLARAWQREIAYQVKNLANCHSRHQKQRIREINK